jgi:hypothetical protein
MSNKDIEEVRAKCTAKEDITSKRKRSQKRKSATLEADGPEPALKLAVAQMI